MVVFTASHLVWTGLGIGASRYTEMTLVQDQTHRIHVCYIYGNIYHQYTPFMLAYIPAPWILWVMMRNRNSWFFPVGVGAVKPSLRKPVELYFLMMPGRPGRGSRKLLSKAYHTVLYLEGPTQFHYLDLIKRGPVKKEEWVYESWWFSDWENK